MGKKIDLTGQTFGRLVVIAEAGRTKSRNILWNCRCSCGNETVVSSGDLRKGDTASCGCARREASSTRLRTHGLSRTPLYIAWNNMKQRCQNPRDPRYPDYGGRGIAVCQRWLSLEAFIADMGPTWRPGLTLDRVDVNGNYELSNCRWITHAEQQRNRRNNLALTFRGESRPLAEWAELLGLRHQTVRSRLRSGWSVERALTEGAAPERSTRRGPASTTEP